MKHKARVEKVFKRSKKRITPTLLKFQNGELTTIDKKNTQFCLTKCSTTNDKGALFTTNEHHYYGIVNEDAAAKQLTDMYICVRNRTTKTMRIIPVDEVLLKNQIYNKLETPVSHKLSKERVKEKLLREFGGRKAARYVDNKEKMNISMGIVEEDLSKSILDNTLNESENGIKAPERNELLMPKVNKDAKALCEVYDTNDIVPKELIDRLDEEAKAVYVTALEDLPIDSEYLLKCIRHIQKSPQSATVFYKIKLIIYMDCLINFIKTRARAIKHVEFSKITDKVEKDVRIRFSDPGAQFTRTAFSKEKAICYYLVLALLCSDDYELNVNSLSKELSIPPAKVIKYARMIGGKRKGVGSDVVKLCLPEEFTSVAVKTPRKRKL